MGSHRLILDGELVGLTAGGRPSFQALRLRLGPQLGSRPLSEPPRSALAYLIFDLLYLDGRTLLEESKTLGLEGVVAKKLASPYRPGARNGAWLKVKLPRTQPFVIVGWMPSDVHADRIGSLVLAVYDVTVNEAAEISRRQRLLYAGRVGTGFNQRTLELLPQILLPLRIEHNPLDEGGSPCRRALVRPELVCEVTFREWTLGARFGMHRFNGYAPISLQPTWRGRADRARDRRAS